MIDIWRAAVESSHFRILTLFLLNDRTVSDIIEIFGQSQLYMLCYLKLLLRQD